MGDMVLMIGQISDWLFRPQVCVTFDGRQVVIVGLISDWLFKLLVCVIFDGRHDVTDWSDL